MKKIILIAMVMLGVAFTSNAQNANRSGVFVELTPGMTIVPDGYGHHMMCNFSMSLDAGYRWAFSTNWALDGRFKVQSILADGDECMVIVILPALRYTSSELSNDSNKSFYASIGIGYDFLVYEGFGYDVQLGFNLSNHFYLGLKTDGYINYGNHIHYPVGVCLGYRF